MSCTIGKNGRRYYFDKKGKRISEERAKSQGITGCKTKEKPPTKRGAKKSISSRRTTLSPQKRLVHLIIEDIYNDNGDLISTNVLGAYSDRKLADENLPSSSRDSIYWIANLPLDLRDVISLNYIRNKIFS